MALNQRVVYKCCDSKSQGRRGCNWSFWENINQIHQNSSVDRALQVCKPYSYDNVIVASPEDEALLVIYEQQAEEAERQAEVAERQAEEAAIRAKAAREKANYARNFIIQIYDNQL